MIKITRRGGGYSFVDVTPYSGGTLTFKSGHLKKKGKYIVTVFFKKNPGSRWLSSSDGDQLPRQAPLNSFSGDILEIEALSWPSAGFSSVSDLSRPS